MSEDTKDVVGNKSHFLLGGSAPSWSTSHTAVCVCRFLGQIIKLAGFREYPVQASCLDVEPETRKAAGWPRPLGRSAAVLHPDPDPDPDAGV